MGTIIYGKDPFITIELFYMIKVVDVRTTFLLSNIRIDRDQYLASCLRKTAIT